MKTKKIIIIVAIISILIILIALVLFLIKKYSYDPKYEIITDLNTISIGNSYFDNYNIFNYGKIMKSSGIFEGLFEIEDNDIYKITVNTNNLLFFDSCAILDYSQCGLCIFDNTNEKITVSLNVFNGKRENSYISQLNEKQYTYNNWVFTRSLYNYNFSNTADTKACIQISIFEDLKKLKEDKFIDFSKTLLNSINIEYLGKKDTNKYLHCTNVLAPVDLSNIVLSNRIKVDLLTNASVYMLNNTDSYYTCQHNIFFALNSDYYKFQFSEMKNFNIKEYKETFYNLTWNTLEYNGIQFFVSSYNNKFSEMYFEVDGITYGFIPLNQIDIDYIEMTKLILQKVLKVD